MIELVIAIMIGVILTSIAMATMRNVQGRYAVRGATSAFITIHAQNRARAIERGQNSVLYMDLANDSASVVQGGTVVETVHFDDDYNVDFTGPTGPLELCMNPRGYAETSCTSFNTTQTVRFVFAGDTSTVQILALGQLIY